MKSRRRKKWKIIKIKYERKNVEQRKNREGK
jgi:hypothetical protein